LNIVDRIFKSGDCGIGQCGGNDLVVGVLHGQWPGLTRLSNHAAWAIGPIFLLISLGEEAPETIVEAAGGGGPHQVRVEAAV